MPKQYYYKVIIKAPRHLQELKFLLCDIYSSSIEEDENTLVMAFDEFTNEDKLLLETVIDEVFKQLNTTTIYSLNIKKEKNIDWIDEYKKHFTPIVVDPFYIKGSWHTEHKDLINITIDPDLVFGTGHHNTTKSCLMAIGKYCKKDHELLDVGCGSGILAMGAAKLGLSVTICDSDELAVSNAKNNFKINNLEFQNAWIGSVDNCKKEFDFVVANIVADVLIALKKQLQKCVKNGGIIILSGILDKYLQRVLDTYKELSLVEVIELGEWRTIIFKKE